MEYNLCAAMKEVFRNLEILNFHGFGMITVGQPSSQEEKKKTSFIQGFFLQKRKIKQS